MNMGSGLYLTLRGGTSDTLIQELGILPGIDSQSSGPF